jgi:UDP-glucose pyrophosphorylase
LEQNLKDKGKTDLLKLVEQTTDINLYFIRQSHPRGLGDAVLMAKDFVGDEPFVVMLGDDIMEDKVPLTKQLMQRYEDTHASTLAVMKVPHQEVNKYGVIDPAAQTKPGLYDVKRFVEKPDVDKAPSDLAIIGRYLLTPEIFQMLETQKPGAGNEVQLTDAIDRLNKIQRVFAHEFKGDRFDVGYKFGYLKTSIEFGLRHPEVKDELRAYIKDLSKKIK